MDVVESSPGVQSMLRELAALGYSVDLSAALIELAPGELDGSSFSVVLHPDIPNGAEEIEVVFNVSDSIVVGGSAYVMPTTEEGMPFPYRGFVGLILDSTGDVNVYDRLPAWTHELQRTLYASREVTGDETCRDCQAKYKTTLAWMNNYCEDQRSRFLVDCFESFEIGKGKSKACLVDVQTMACPGRFPDEISSGFEAPLTAELGFYLNQECHETDAVCDAPECGDGRPPVTINLLTNFQEGADYYDPEVVAGMECEEHVYDECKMDAQGVWRWWNAETGFSCTVRTGTGTENAEEDIEPCGCEVSIYPPYTTDAWGLCNPGVGFHWNGGDDSSNFLACGFDIPPGD